MKAWFRKKLLRYQIWRWIRAMNQMTKWMGKVQKTLGVVGAPVLKEQPKSEEWPNRQYERAVTSRDLPLPDRKDVN